MEKIRNFDCKCYGRRKKNFSLRTESCSRKLSPEFMYNIQMDYLTAERVWQDMRISGHLEAKRCNSRNFSDDNIHREDTNEKKTRQDNSFDWRHRSVQEYLSVSHGVSLTTF
ncbi:hypothetical protein XENORESO_003185 [Xenotaenia resolanae]|uniref:Uncharacterized protein n=1 Tax=Xenotaenia resolanae TaxID=208358 RepID=A0ABV0X488_9TELE